jgi:acetyl esterase/lipase
LADYRIKNKHNTTPFESLKDAKSAMRYVRGHAKELGINPDSIIAAGGSAGGHLAAATAFIKGYNEVTDDLSVSCIPQALVLFNPVIDNGPGGYGYERIGDQYKEFSPIINLKKNAPPTVFFSRHKR